MEITNTAIVLGGGLSGISCAVQLNQMGYHVSLVESRKFLGGRSFSFNYQSPSEIIDNGQHVVLGCCTYFFEFLDTIEASQYWESGDILNISMRDTCGNKWSLRETKWLFPIHLLPSLLNFPFLSYVERIGIIFALVMAKIKRENHAMQNESFHDWLKKCRQSDRVIKRFWSVIVKPVFNDGLDNISASMGVMFIKVALLGKRGSSNVFYPIVGLSNCIGKPSEDYLASVGCDLYLGNSVDSILRNDDRVSGIRLSNGRVLNSDIVVSALPYPSLLRVLGNSAIDLEHVSGDISKLRSSGIINVYLWYKRPLMEEKFCMVVGSPIESIFNRTDIISSNYNAGEMIASDSRYYCAALSIGNAQDYMKWNHEEIVVFFTQELVRIFADPDLIMPVHSKIIKQHEATIRCQPGSTEYRSDCMTSLDNFFIAGDWTRTGWPSTMEGAVRSGYHAAKYVHAVYSA